MLGVFNYKMLVLDFTVLFSRAPVGNEMKLCTLWVMFHFTVLWAYERCYKKIYEFHSVFNTRG
jgi:hypothetical protein